MSTNDEAAIRAAAEATALFENPLFQRVLGGIENRLHRDWAASDPADTAGRELIYSQLLGVKSLKGELTKIKQGGTVAERKLNRQQNGGENGSTRVSSRRPIRSPGPFDA